MSKQNQHDPLGLAAKASTIVPAGAVASNPAPVPGDAGQVLSVEGLDAPVRGQTSAPVPAERPVKSYIVLIRNAKTGTLHTVTRGPGIIAELEDMEQAANLALSIKSCQNNPWFIAPIHE